MNLFEKELLRRQSEEYGKIEKMLTGDYDKMEQYIDSFGSTEKLSGALETIKEESEAAIKELARIEAKLSVAPATELLKMKAKERPYLIEGMIVEGAINCITASTNEGKSLLAWKMISDMANGERFLGEFETKKTRTLILDLEMDRNEIIERLQAFVPKEACKNIGIIDGQTFNVENETQYKELVEILKEGGYDMLTIDALSSFHTRDENSNSEMAKINKILLRLSRQEGYTILFLHHDRKPFRGEIKTKHSARGASIIIDNANSQILLEGSWNRAEDKLVMRIRQGKARKALRYPPIIVSCKYDKETKKSEWKYVGVFQEDLVKSERAKILVLKFLKEYDHMTYDEMNEKAESKGMDIGLTNIKSAVRELTKLGTIRSKSSKEINVSGQKKHFCLIVENDGLDI